MDTALDDSFSSWQDVPTGGNGNLRLILKPGMVWGSRGSECRGRAVALSLQRNPAVFA